LLLAGIVCLVHAYQLSGYQQLSIINIILSSSIAVKAFFVVSGFLIFMSFERSSSIFSYANKRIRRIYPAYFTAVIVCAVALFFISSQDVKSYFSFEWLKYFFANISFLNFLHHTLPGVFESNKAHAVNGALWTLKIEVLFYFSVPIIVFLFQRIGRLTVIISIYFLSVIYVSLCSWMAEKTGSNVYSILGRQLPGQLSYFIAGAFFYYYLPIFERKIGFFLLFSIAIFTINTWWEVSIFEPFALAIIVLFFALFIPLGNFGKYGDFSYGVYILHFPIIQCFIQYGWFSSTPWIFLIYVVFTTLVTAIVMWHFVEKRFLFKKSHYITTSA
jgi:peptidoglycan/LPS O-acetylase OafA/YrhL